MKWNFKWRAIILTVMLALGVETSYANSLTDSISFNPYIGVEYQYQHMKGNLDWSKVLPADFNNGGVFIGTKYHKNFGFEIGYYRYLKKSRNVSALPSFNGQLASATAENVAVMRNKGFSFAWNVYVPLDPNFDLMFIASLVTVHPEIVITGTGSDLASALSTVKAKNRTILRLGIGGEYAEQHWGARGRVLWDRTQNLYVNTNNATNFQAITKKAFKQTMTITVGVFYKF